MIKVFIIDDSMFIRNSLMRILNSVDEISIIGDASNPIDAMQMFADSGFPDVIILDLEMPKMDGLEFLKKLKNEKFIPTIVFSSFVSQNSQKAIEALELGACDIILKPSNQKELKSDKFKQMLVDNIKSASNSINQISCNIKKSTKYEKSDTTSFQKVIAIGASTGGVQVLENILINLKSNHLPILITQHMPENFTAAFANRLNKICKNSIIKEAINNDLVKKGFVYISPGNLHLELYKDKNNNYFTLLKDYPEVSNHKPSVDVLFSSFSKVLKENSIAFILTGMGKDGALGIKKIKDVGGKTYAQDKKSSVVYGMPKVAFEIGGIDKQVSINEIIDIINNEK